ncbi:GntR family transcriptional regulator [Bradyrhizobium sp. 169]|uniref:GntR family transcriptional regulator n=1 Tax=Bradyrhizobium sp. 169 TaxID=2782640 RepID=UPI001FF8A0DD|nr:GntR family transcriptional regulator [Bradyrhizobium sp. 169]MCK1589087.1 GntR family transcriptional regulator [Bradyrhizobium sp. 169]
MPKLATAPADQVQRAKSLTATVVDRLRSRIIDGSIPLGSMLSEKSLAESYGVSKTPVREALVQLQAVGLVTILPQRGGLVFQPSADQVRELCEVRLELESAGLRFSIERNNAKLVELLASIVTDMEECFDVKNPRTYQQLDNAFHNAFFVNCGNSLLAKAYEAINPRISALRTHLSTPQIYLLKRSLEEHRLMVDLVRDGDQPTALQLLREHIRRTQEFHSRAILKPEALEGSSQRGSHKKPPAKKTKR